MDKVATHLSMFTNPNIPELVLRDDKTLQNNMLEGIFGAFSGEKNSHVRHMMTNIVRRVWGSIECYKRGREQALDYVAGDRYSNFSLYFSALVSFESCISYSWQVVDLLRGISKQNVFQPGDESAWERLHGVYTYGTKHSFGQYDEDKRLEMPTTIWLTNCGVSCVSDISISYIELTEIIASNNDLFYEIQRKAHEKRQKKQISN
jgi:hypothetical protein